ncbi:hypothetical protein ANN_17881 [Periplaneta americana]|uniref:Uncharacterized protein n=1 Tax=Periplaneta americana TaxID=6978 RepID=A0ABQ8SVH6_PERAM|nr:hypothetical protein ANN_17881 [Periplaneta americana]
MMLNTNIPLKKLSDPHFRGFLQKFSRYKNCSSDRRRRFSFDNLREYIVVYCDAGNINKRRQDQQQPVLKMANSTLKHVNEISMKLYIRVYINHIKMCFNFDLNRVIKSTLSHKDWENCTLCVGNLSRFEYLKFVIAKVKDSERKIKYKMFQHANCIDIVQLHAGCYRSLTLSTCSFTIEMQLGKGEFIGNTTLHRYTPKQGNITIGTRLCIVRHRLTRSHDGHYSHKYEWNPKGASCIFGTTYDENIAYTCGVTVSASGRENKVARVRFPVGESYLVEVFSEQNAITYLLNNISFATPCYSIHVELTTLDCKCKYCKLSRKKAQNYFKFVVTSAFFCRNGPERVPRMRCGELNLDSC